MAESLVGVLREQPIQLIVDTPKAALYALKEGLASLGGIPTMEAQGRGALAAHHECCKRFLLLVWEKAAAGAVLFY